MDLSPAAQAVLDAYGSSPLLNDHVLDHRHCLAAALRTVVEYVAPDDAVEPRNYLPMAMECQRIRHELLAIAAELEALE